MEYKLLQYFKWEHLPEHLQQISYPFEQLAKKVVDQGGDIQEIEACLRKLLEAKDCAVRAAL